MYISYFYYRFLIFNSVRSTVNLHWSSDSFFLFWWLANINFFFNMLSFMNSLFIMSAWTRNGHHFIWYCIKLCCGGVAMNFEQYYRSKHFSRLFFLLPVSVFPLKTQRNNHFQNLSNSIQLAFIGNFNSFSKMSFLKAQN